MSWLWSLLVLYGLFVALLFAMQRQLLYHPSSERPDPAAQGVPGLRAATVEAADGVPVVHWYRPPVAPNGPVVAIFQGNAGHLGHRVPKYRALLDAGFGMLFVGYRGYGGNPGRPNEAGLVADGRAALGWLAAQGVAPGRTLLYGESLGTALAVRLAAELAGQGAPCAGLILEAPFTSIADVAQGHYWYVPARWLLLDKWPVAPYIVRTRTPLLVIHGERDRTVPFRHGKRLFDLAPEPKEGLFLSAADHNDLFDDPAVPARVIDFVRRQVPAAAATD